MTFQPMYFPGQFDMLHLILLVVAFILLLLLLLKKPVKNIEPEAVNEPKPVETKNISCQNTHSSALQLLSILQQNGRFIDFIQEDLTQFSDTDIGAAARVVHQGSQKVLKEYFSFSPVCDKEEETPVTLEEGFNAQEYQLTGQVTGKAPFKGTLIHKGWRADSYRMPEITQGHDYHIIAKAEVEL